MPNEECFGIIPVRHKGTEWEVLLVKHNKGHWSFPKGHPSPNETPFQIAERELLEETGLSVVKFLHREPFIESYTYEKEGTTMEKMVSYFLAEVSKNVHLLDKELCGYQWTSFDEAYNQITFDQARRICSKAQSLLSTCKYEVND